MLSGIVPVTFGLSRIILTELINNINVSNSCSFNSQTRKEPRTRQWACSDLQSDPELSRAILDCIESDYTKISAIYTRI